MQNILMEPIFQALFNSPVPQIIVKADAPVYTIVTSSDAHKFATNLTGRQSMANRFGKFLILTAPAATAVNSFATH
jgi:hypothetical protein